MRIAGLYVPLLTPLADDGALALDALGGHVERLLAAGIDGVVALGTTGEFADLTGDERVSVVATTVDVVDQRVPVLVGVGGVGTTESCEHARAAATAGADGLLALPPLYWKLGERGLVRHFAAVAAATDLPVLVYDFPALAGTALQAGLVQRIAETVPGVVGIKLSGPELRTVHAVLSGAKAAVPDFAVLVGSADLALPALLAGADGMIAALGNVAPEPLVALDAAVRAGDLDQAARQHARIRALLEITAGATPPILALKAAARAAGSPLAPVVRTPPEDPEAVVAGVSERMRALR